MPQLLKATPLEPVCHKTSHCTEKPAHCIEEKPLLEKPECSNKDPAQPKINKNN